MRHILINSKKGEKMTENQCLCDNEQGIPEDNQIEYICIEPKSIPINRDNEEKIFDNYSGIEWTNEQTLFVIKEILKLLHIDHNNRTIQTIFELIRKHFFNLQFLSGFIFSILFSELFLTAFCLFNMRYLGYRIMFPLDGETDSLKIKMDLISVIIWIVDYISMLMIFLFSGLIVCFKFANTSLYVELYSLFMILWDY